MVRKSIVANVGNKHRKRPSCLGKKPEADIDSSTQWGHATTFHGSCSYAPPFLSWGSRCICQCMLGSILSSPKAVSDNGEEPYSNIIADCLVVGMFHVSASLVIVALGNETQFSTRYRMLAWNLEKKTRSEMSSVLLAMYLREMISLGILSGASKAVIVEWKELMQRYT